MANPYASAAKTAEIMSRYRPIAPKPMEGGAVAVQGGDGCGGGGSGGGSVAGMSEKIRQSPYLRNLWPKLQARPTRTRKRGRMIGVSVTPSAFKRTSPPQAVASRGAAAAFLGLAPPLQYYAVKSGWFGPGFVASGAVERAASAPAAAAERLVTLPLLPSSRASSSSPERSKGIIDLNSMVEATPEEKGLTLQLRGPSESSACSGSVISPRPIRPVGSCIIVISVNTVNEVNAHTPASFTSVNGVNAAKIYASLKNPNEVEAEIEAEVLPAIVTDSKNRVRLTNSAYNEMVGQPECMWLGSMGGGGRIGGEVVIKTAGAVSAASDCLTGGFKAQVRIEWGSGGGRRRKAAVDACCDVERLRCVSKDYVFAWRFGTAAEP
uniref:Uncharacterized protein n=1 Tax=Kalanchoe fedtschenkoi TaxID=63787 RepID=A0A7N0SXK0_KALFE